MICLWESHNLATVPLGNFHRAVRALHVADEHLVEVLHGIKHLLQVLRCVIGVDDYRYFVCFVHIVQRYDLK